MDFTTYGLEELFSALETVDGYEYPENALKIYSKILDKLNLDSKNATPITLGYNTDCLYETTSFPDIGFLSDSFILKSDMRHKINRLNSMLQKEKNVS
ncbi:hypothetical protein [Pleionea sp. CnH1-48]|uniref:hypothetical protein n=1 Tax=Pleionea sp. CnH1-48 TaxID=2954494 RepID=UPI002096BDBC|nr:hypothetical protein [Pleionea sp. CnH1-48]MCO7223206.1 hypothetical protein [Pleionea sp. CnH1-48]